MEFYLRRVNDLAYEAFRRPGTGPTRAKPILTVFVHGNGLSRGIFRKMIEETSSRIPTSLDFHAISVDLAGHGSSLRANFEGYESFGANAPDIRACVKHYRSEHQFSDTILVGHSMGGHAALIAQLQDKTLFSKALLIEPMIHASFSPDRQSAPFLSATLRRKTVFESREAAIDYFSSRGIFKSWQKRCVVDYVDTASYAIPGTQNIQLSCSPKVEVNNFQMDVSEVYGDLERIKFDKVIVLEGADSGYLPAGVLKDVAVKLNGRYVCIANGHHIIQCEMPDVAAAYLAEIINDSSSAATYNQRDLTPRESSIKSKF